MLRKQPKMLYLIVFACFSFLLFSTGCSHYSKPKTVPEVPLDNVGPFSTKLSVDLINNQPDVSQTLYGSLGAHRYYANYNEWTEFFINQWSTELKKRGVQVGPESPNKINVLIDGFALLPGVFVIRANMDLYLSSPDRSWEKKKKCTDASGWSGGRAFGGMIHRALTELLQDQEVLDRMKE